MAVIVDKVEELEFLSDPCALKRIENLCDSQNFQIDDTGEDAVRKEAMRRFPKTIGRIVQGVASVAEERSKQWTPGSGDKQLNRGLVTNKATLHQENPYCIVPLQYCK